MGGGAGKRGIKAGKNGTTYNSMMNKIYFKNKNSDYNCMYTKVSVYIHTHMYVSIYCRSEATEKYKGYHKSLTEYQHPERNALLISSFEAFLCIFL